jgi:hypothetical protein
MHHLSRQLRIFLMFSSIVQIATLLLGLSAARSTEQATLPIVWTDASAFRRLLPPRFPNWHLNDHAIFRADDGTWHLFSIAAKNPDADRSESRNMSDREKAVSLEAQRHHPLEPEGRCFPARPGWHSSARPDGSLSKRFKALGDLLHRDGRAPAGPSCGFLSNKPKAGIEQGGLYLLPLFFNDGQ